MPDERPSLCAHGSHSCSPASLKKRTSLLHRPCGLAPAANLEIRPIRLSPSATGFWRELPLAPCWKQASLTVRAGPQALLVVLYGRGVALPAVEGLHWAGANGRNPRECYAGCRPYGHGRAPCLARPGHSLAFPQGLDD